MKPMEGRPASNRKKKKNRGGGGGGPHTAGGPRPRPPPRHPAPRPQRCGPAGSLSFKPMAGRPAPNTKKKKKKGGQRVVPVSAGQPWNTRDGQGARVTLWAGCAGTGAGARIERCSSREPTWSVYCSILLGSKTNCGNEAGRSARYRIIISRLSLLGNKFPTKAKADYTMRVLLPTALRRASILQGKWS